MKGHPCKRCLVRYPQSKGVCRRCARELGLDTLTTFERERQRLERHRESVQMVDATPRTSRTVQVDGQEFEVVWP